jgi:hypothetical protein
MERQKALGKKLVPYVLGWLALLGGIAILAANEWRAGRNDQAIGTLLQEVREVDRSGGIPSGVPVRLTGDARVGASLRDPLLPVEERALRLDRQVEMYQWREIVEGTGDNRSIRHEAVWSSRVIDSTRFLTRGPVNPGRMPLDPVRVYAADARLGQVGLSRDALDALPATGAVTPSEPAPIQLSDLTLVPDASGYRSGDPQRPAVGDVRIRFEAVQPGTITVVGAVQDGRIGAWMAPNGSRVLLADAGTHTAGDLAADAKRIALPGLWGMRFVGTIASLVGLALLWPHLPLRRLLGRARGPGALVGALALTAIAIAAGWALFRTPLGWP